MRVSVGHLVKRHLPGGTLGGRTLQVRDTHHSAQPTNPQAEGRRLLENLEASFVVLLQATIALR